MAEDKSKFKFQVGDLKALGGYNPRANIEELKKKTEFNNRQNETAIVSEDDSNVSFRMFDNKAMLASSKSNSIKMNDQQQSYHSYEEKHVTNRTNTESYEFVLNGHKLNPNLWEYSDMREYVDAQGGKYPVGGFCMLGTILTKSWDAQLKRYVLVRRLARIPMFSPELNVPEILKALDIPDPTKVAYQYGYKQQTESAKEYYQRVAGQAAEESNESGSASADTKTQEDDKKDESGEKDSGNTDSSSDSVADMMKKYEAPLSEEEGEEFLQRMMSTVPETNEKTEESLRHFVETAKTKGRKAAAEELTQTAQIFLNKGANNYASWANSMSDYIRFYKLR